MDGLLSSLTTYIQNISQSLLGLKFQCTESSFWQTLRGRGCFISLLIRMPFGSQEGFGEVSFQLEACPNPR